MKTKIILEDIKIYAYHGCLEEENIIGTYYLINAEIHSDISKATQSDDLEDTINYALINDIIHDEMKVNSKLLEHVLGRIVRRLKSEFPQIDYINIKLTKTNPPLSGELKGVSIQIEQAF